MSKLSVVKKAYITIKVKIEVQIVTESYTYHSFIPKISFNSVM